MATNQLVNRERLLAEFDLLTEQDVAALFGVDVKTLKNRPLSAQPAFAKVGRARLYHRQAVAEYLARNNMDGTPLPPFSRPRDRKREAAAKVKPPRAKAKPRAKPSRDERRISP